MGVTRRREEEFVQLEQEIIELSGKGFKIIIFKCLNR